jgi:hypothetical protein
MLPSRSTCLFACLFACSPTCSPSYAVRERCVGEVVRSWRGEDEEEEEEDVHLATSPLEETWPCRQIGLRHRALHFIQETKIGL